MTGGDPSCERCRVIEHLRAALPRLKRKAMMACHRDQQAWLRRNSAYARAFNTVLAHDKGRARFFPRPKGRLP